MLLLVPLDLSDATPPVLAIARHAAQTTGASVVLLHVAEPEPAFIGYDAGPDVVREQVAHEYREQHQVLHSHGEALRAEGITTTALLIQGQIAQCILNEAGRLGADLIVMGTHGRGAMFDLIVGSVSHAVIRDTSISVLLVPLRKH
jgi:nucleotide-binding universal stress UspA family protein